MVIPCIDLMGGKVTQLIGGEKLALQRDDLDSVLTEFQAFPLVHVIDLDAAMGTGDNSAMVESIAKRRPARVGGGVRTFERASKLLDLGAQQVIVGTAAYRDDGLNEPFLTELSSRLGSERLCLAVDSKGGQVAVNGWKKTLALTSAQAVRMASDLVGSFLCTYVDGEGAMSGTDLQMFAELRALTDGVLIAAGGISTLAEIEALERFGVDVALGMAIYTGALDLKALASREALRPAVRKMTGYKAAPHRTESIRLDSNENPFGPSPMAEAAASKALASLHRYPDASGSALKMKIADRLGLSPSNVLLSNGSDELIQLLGLCLLEPSSEVVVAKPTFVVYEAVSSVAGAKIVRVPLDSTGRHDLPAMAAACNERTRLVFVANPHNPTGTTASGIEAFLDALPPKAVAVLDEAYFEFASDMAESSADFVRAGRNVVGLRTFSKAYGLAGIRLGYGFAPLWLAQGIETIRGPFNVNSVAQAAGMAALDDFGHLSRTVANASVGRSALVSWLSNRGVRCFESEANFVYALFSREGVAEELVAQGVLVRSGRAFGDPFGARITVGTPEEIQRLTDALDTVLNAKA